MLVKKKYIYIDIDIDNIYIFTMVNIGLFSRAIYVTK